MHCAPPPMADKTATKPPSDFELVAAHRAQQQVSGVIRGACIDRSNHLATRRLQKRCCRLPESEGKA